MENNNLAKEVIIISEDNTMAIGNIPDKRGYQKLYLDIHKLSSAIETLKNNQHNGDRLTIFVKKDHPIQIGFKEYLGIIISPIVEEK